MDKGIRWRQRFQNLQKAYLQFESAVLNFDNLTQLEKEGLIQRYEYTFELSWKTVKDYLEAKGVNVLFPRDVIKEAFHYGIIEDGELWLDMLEKRNLLAHTYDEKRFNIAMKKINQEYYHAISQVYKYLGDEYELWSK